jgi:hypothetical protein
MLGKPSQLLNCGMGLMPDLPESSIRLMFTGLFKRRLKGLAKRYRQIQSDIQQ